MPDKTPVIERCPRCDREHERGPYVDRKDSGETVFAPADIECPCGLSLRWRVPFFKTTASGYVLAVRKDVEPPRR